MRALGNRILVKPAAPEETTKAGIILPKKDKNDHGEVVNIGSAVNKHNGTQVNVGDIIYYPKNGAEPVEDDSDLVAVKREDVFLKIIK